MDDKKLIDDVILDVGDALQSMIVANFNAAGFFGRPWPVKKMPDEGVVSHLFKEGKLRRSIRVVKRGSAIVVTSGSVYASIHNEGGKIKVPVTDKMRRYFWHKYYELTGKSGSGSRGGIRPGRRSEKKRQGQGRRNDEKISAYAAMCKAIALTPKQYMIITIPRRQFVGNHPEVTKAVQKISAYHLNKFTEELMQRLKK